MTEDSTEPGGQPLTPFLEKKIAIPGEYIKKLEASPFGNSRVMRTAAVEIESGRFVEAVKKTMELLSSRGISFEYPASEERYGRGTRRLADGHETIILDDKFSQRHPLRQVFDLLHRNMSLILQRSGAREDKKMIRKLLEMDLAFAELARLGAQATIDREEREKACDAADEIEIETKHKLTWFGDKFAI